MKESAWTLAELQAALDKAKHDTDEANRAIGSYHVDGHVETRPAYREAVRRLPELRKVETLLLERIQEALSKPREIGTMEIGEGIEDGQHVV